METKRRKSGGRRPVLLLLVGCFTVILVLWLVYVLSVFKTFAWLTAKQETAVVEKSSISLPPSLEARILRPGAGLVDDARRMLETADIAAATGDPGLLSDVFNMAKNLAMDLIEREQRFQLEVDATRAATAAALALEKSAAALIASNKPVNLDKMGSVIDPLDPQRLYTQQTTYLGGDEAEVSVFDNLLCFDGRSPIVTMDNPIRNPDRILDYTHACADFRYYEPSSLEYSGCMYYMARDRPYNQSLPRLPSTDFPLPLHRRRWGPSNRNGNLYFKELHPTHVWGNQPERVFAALKGENSAAAAAGGGSGGAGGLRGGGGGASAVPTYNYDPGDPRYYDTQMVSGDVEELGLPDLPNLKVRAKSRVGNRTIHWLDGALWLTGLDGQFHTNPYHWSSKILSLYEALRSNATPTWGDHPNDGTIHWLPSYDISVRKAIFREDDPPPLPPNRPDYDNRERAISRNRASYKQGAQWDLPPMDNVVFTGDGSIVIKNFAMLGDWFQHVTRLSTQPHSQLFFADLLNKLDENTVICSTRGAMTGAKNKMFTARADGWMFRQYAYSVTNMAAKGRRPHPAYPPRKVTIIDRKGMNGRGFYNRDELIAAVAATGLPYELVPSMGALSFEKQVELMAGTGILIAPHGAALANAMFLPAHAVVMEVFPYLMKKNTYHHLAIMMDLHYMPVYSWELLPVTMTQYYGVELMNERYYYDNCVARNISSYDALTVHACNAASKNYPIVVPFPYFSAVLRDAVDAIAAYSLMNPEWKEASVTEGQPIPPFQPPPDAKGDEHGING